MKTLHRIFLLALLAALISIQGMAAERMVAPSKGQLVYVPVYSLIYFGDREHKFNLAVTLSLRNTDTENSIIVKKIDYFGENGNKVRGYASEPIELSPLETKSVVIKESDTTGGAGASFVVEWNSSRPVSPPIIETIMIGAQSQQGMSFSSRGVTIRELD